MVINGGTTKTTLYQVNKQRPKLINCTGHVITYNNNNNKALLPYSMCKMLHDELECSLTLTHIVPIYTITLNMANKYKI